MKGLLIKDYFLLFQRKRTMIIFLLLCIFMGVSMDGYFIIGYMTILGAIFSIGTISFDELDGGMTFLLTMPVERKTYAVSKYVFSFFICVVSMVTAIVLMFIINTVKGTPVDAEDAFITALTIIPVAVIMLDVMIPVQLKFGAEKSRIVQLIIAAAIFASATLVTKEIANKVNVSEFVEKIDELSPAVFIGGAVIACIVATAVSVIVSTKIMEKKTF